MTFRSWMSEKNRIKTHAPCDLKFHVEFVIQNESTLSVQYSNIMGGWQGDGNIDLDPLFVGSGDHPYELQDISPCVNEGTPDTAGFILPEFDLAGNPRIYGGRIEIGAYENQNVIIGIKKVNNINIPIKCYPNPVNSNATIEFILQQPEYVSLTIYSALGQEISILVLDQLNAGNHKIPLLCRSSASGPRL